MTAPLEGPGRDQARAIVDAGRLWTRGMATALVVALIVLVGVLISRVVGVPGLAGDQMGTLATASLASYAAMWTVTTLLLTGALHLLLLLAPRPLRLFNLVASVLVLMTLVAPFTAGASFAAALAGALINLVAGGAAGALLAGAGRDAAGASQAGARRPRR
jgi:Family of unknown function (DUF6069)